MENGVVPAPGSFRTVGFIERRIRTKVINKTMKTEIEKKILAEITGFNRRQQRLNIVHL